MARIIGAESAAAKALRERDRIRAEGREAGAFLFNGTWFVFAPTPLIERELTDTAY